MFRNLSVRSVLLPAWFKSLSLQLREFFWSTCPIAREASQALCGSEVSLRFLCHPAVWGSVTSAGVGGSALSGSPSTAFFGVKYVLFTLVLSPVSWLVTCPPVLGGVALCSFGEISTFHTEPRTPPTSWAPLLVFNPPMYLRLCAFRH